ncbi:Na+/H+ antiporter subunit E [Micrococcus sp.]|uniref:Na+/H+ antiporter subunit E n=1 Tax=Micrococcus sp. TaxID=1271 RepID=UPI002A91ECB5|nr:Na+/H+ antiporter subunit E [Micrococcus sp.]MDY6054895.1 Na+/H+ antiporter subunit E [Micrococcus sp.]
MPTAEPVPTTGSTATVRQDHPTAQRPVRGLHALLAQWPLLLVMLLLWCALWQDFSLHVVLTGVLFSTVVVVLFPMPAIPFPGRLHPWWSLVFGVRFLADVVRSSVAISATVLLRGRRARSSVVGVRLRSHDDLVTTLVSHALALVPGSIVLDVDRARATLYLHVLDATDDDDVEAYRRTALNVEAGIIRAVGSREDVELLRRHPDQAPPEDELDDLRRNPVYPQHALPDTPDRVPGTPREESR